MRAHVSALSVSVGRSRNGSGGWWRTAVAAPAVGAGIEPTRLEPRSRSPRD